MKNPLKLLLGLCCLLLAGTASAVTLNFVELPNEGGIHFSGDTVVRIINNDVPGSETYHVATTRIPSPGEPPADALVRGIGTGFGTPYYLFNILESPGGPISDQVYVHNLGGPGTRPTVIDFLSDSNTFVDLTPTATVVETGRLQLVGTYVDDRGQTVFLNVKSDLESVPDAGSTISLLGFGLLGLVAIRRKLAF